VKWIDQVSPYNDGSCLVVKADKQSRQFWSKSGMQEFLNAIKLRLKGNYYAQRLLKPLLQSVRSLKAHPTQQFPEREPLIVSAPEIEAPPSPSAFLHNIDFPRTNEVVQFPVLILSGWIAFDKAYQITQLEFGTELGYRFPLTGGDRPDVEAVYPHLAAIGFLGCIPIDAIQDAASYFVQFQLDNEQHRFPVDCSISLPDIEEFINRKQQKRQRLQTLLCCPICKSEELIVAIARLDCRNCGATFKTTEQGFNFLSQDLVDHGNVQPTNNVSFRSYDENVLSLIREFPDGLILDNGCGMRDVYFDNVVNFEIVDYPTTDVLGIGEKLPFKSGSFDAIVSFAVLEHVRNPFECAAEIIRVLKPGGKLYVAVPFLQPFHGYPDHYYNMTSSGLKNLFEQDVEILEAGVSFWGKPIWTLNWFLKSYVRGLPAPVAEKFKQMRVVDFLEYPLNYMDQDFVAQLTPEVDEELACNNYLIARKLTLEKSP